MLDAQADKAHPRRVMNISKGTAVALDGLVLTGGYAPEEFIPEWNRSYPLGGAIRNGGQLALRHCTLVRNHADVRYDRLAPSPPLAAVGPKAVPKLT